MRSNVCQASTFAARQPVIYLLSHRPDKIKLVFTQCIYSTRQKKDIRKERQTDERNSTGLRNRPITTLDEKNAMNSRKRACDELIVLI